MHLYWKVKEKIKTNHGEITAWINTSGQTAHHHVRICEWYEWNILFYSLGPLHFSLNNIHVLLVVIGTFLHHEDPEFSKLGSNVRCILLLSTQSIPRAGAQSDAETRGHPRGKVSPWSSWLTEGGPSPLCASPAVRFRVCEHKIGSFLMPLNSECFYTQQ